MKKFWTLVFVVTVLMLGSSGAVLFAQAAEGSSATQTTGTDTLGNSDKVAMDQGFNFGKFIGAGLSMGLAAIGAGVGVGFAASAAIGAISEKPNLIGPALIFVALAEGICLWGFIIAFMILQR